MMIFITAKFRIRPEHADDWPRISAEFTEATEPFHLDSLFVVGTLPMTLILAYAVAALG